MSASSTIKEAHAKTADDGTKTYRFILLDTNQTKASFSSTTMAKN